MEYAELEPEADLETKPENKPEPQWPGSGAIVAKGVNLQYFIDGPVVLKHVDFNISPKEKVLTSFWFILINIVFCWYNNE